MASLLDFFWVSLWVSLLNFDPLAKLSSDELYVQKGCENLEQSERKT